MNERLQRVYWVGGVTIDTARRQITAAGKEIGIQPRAFDLLVYLLQNRDRAVSKDELQQAVWPDRFISDTVMSRAVMKARKAIGDDSTRQAAIKTLHGHGYRFVAAVSTGAQGEHVAAEAPGGGETNDNRQEASTADGVSPTRARLWVGGLVVIVVATGLIWVAMVRLGGTGRVIATGNQSVGMSTTRWPEAEELFRRNGRLLGATVGPSVDLGSGRVAWLLGVSMVTETPGSSRRDAVFINNAVAIQHGYFPPTATLETHWRTVASAPASFFAEEGATWYWPAQAVLLDQGLLVILHKVQDSSEGLGFRNVRTAWVLIDKPNAPPGEWSWQSIQLPEADAIRLADLSAVQVSGNHLYVLIRHEAGGDGYLMRLPLNQINPEGVPETEWWCGEERGWLNLRGDFTKARPVMNAAGYAFSVQPLPGPKRYIAIETWGFGAAVLSAREAPELTGPWTDRTILFRPAERKRAGVMIHNGHSHPALLGADIVATYNVTSEIFSEEVDDNFFLYPRFVRISLDREGN